MRNPGAISFESPLAHWHSGSAASRARSAYSFICRCTSPPRILLQTLLTVPIWRISSVAAVLGAYGAEIYPTHMRTRGVG